uniref:Neuroglobinlike [Maylandia zebra] n=1 Tax=Lepeophtheirus salmonis TaxID=72036 RepID=A0A0K2TWK8_LEPSM
MGQRQSSHCKYLEKSKCSRNSVPIQSSPNTCSVEHHPSLSNEQLPVDKIDLKVLMEETKSDWEISKEYKALLRQAWRLIQSDLRSVGTVTFLKLFETHPETLTAFIPKVNSLKEIEMNEWYSDNLKSHAIRVMAIIEKVMHRLDDEERAARILIAYGKKHFQIGVKTEMLEKMGESFVTAVEPSLEKVWTQKMAEAWLSLFYFITYFMKLAYPNKPESVDSL